MVVILLQTYFINNNLLMCILGEHLLTARRCILAVEGRIVIEHGLTSYLEAASMLIASYYVLNITYPPEAAATLDFIQR